MKEEIYGLGILRKEKEPYCFPLKLEDIDKLTITYTKKELLEILRKNDSVVTETNENAIQIFKQKEGKWVYAHKEYITKETKYILDFSFSLLFQKEKEERILNILYNHFKTYLPKKHISSNFKEAILAMKENKESFLEQLCTLNYEEQRQIRTYLKKNIDVEKYCLEVLELAEPYQLTKKAS